MSVSVSLCSSPLSSPILLHAAAPPSTVNLSKHVDDGLVYYKQVVAELCSECQVFDSWFLHLQDQMAKNGGSRFRKAFHG